jgi:hypothetical protein
MPDQTRRLLSEYDLQMRLRDLPEDPTDTLVQEIEAGMWRGFLRDSIELRRLWLQRQPPEFGPVPHRLWTRFMYVGFITTLFEMGMTYTALELMGMVTEAIKRGEI